MTSKTYTVATAAELLSTLAKVKGGDTVLLKDGDYGQLKLNPTVNKFNLDFAPGVTIASADANNPASFSGLNLGFVKNLTFDNVVFDYTYKAGDQHYSSPFQLNKSANITIKNSVFDGDEARGMSAKDDGYGMGTALALRDSSGIKIEGNEFFNFYRGVTAGSVQDVVIRDNNIHDMRSEGMNFSTVNRILIEDNTIRDFRASVGSGDHPDMIQFWTTGTTKPTTDVIIRGNTLDMGDGSFTQSIFMRNEVVDSGKGGAAMYYQNVLIEDNVIYNGQLHGITVGETNGLIIRDNSVLRVVDQANTLDVTNAVIVPRINVATASKGVTIEGNITSGVSGHTGQLGWSVRDNAFVQDTNPNAPGYYGHVFVASSLDHVNGVHDFVLLPGGMADRLGAGSSANAFSPVSTKLDAEFHIATKVTDSSVRVFDASFTTAATKLPPGTVYTWDFGDGTVFKGQKVEHSYDRGGSYAVKLTVTLPDGSRSEEKAIVKVIGSDILSMGTDGRFYTHAYGTDTVITAANAVMKPVGGIMTMDLGAKGTVLNITGKHLDGLRGADSMAIGFNLKSDVAGSHGEIFSSLGHFRSFVSTKGEIVVMLTTTSQSVTLVGKGVSMSDMKTHAIDIVFANGTLKLVVDGAVLAQTAVSGTLTNGGLRDIAFGDTWGGRNFDGKLSDFEISRDADDFSPLPAVRPVSAPVVVVPDAAAAAPDAVAGIPDADPPTPTPAPAPVAAKINWTGPVTDLDGLVAAGRATAADNAIITKDATGNAEITLDGTKDHVALGRITALEKSERIAFEVAFTRDAPDAGSERLVWNHQKIGLTVRDDGLMIHAMTKTEGLKAFHVANLGLKDTDAHRAMVMLDAKTDRLQVILDDKVVLDVKNVDFDLLSTSASQWGWSLGSAWNEFYQGDIHDFRLGDRFEFLDNYTPAGPGLGV